MSSPVPKNLKFSVSPPKSDPSFFIRIGWTAKTSAIIAQHSDSWSHIVAKKAQLRGRRRKKFSKKGSPIFVLFSDLLGTR